MENKMKRVFAMMATLFLVIPSVLAAAKEIKTPPRDAATGRFAYQGVVEVDGISAADLYSRAKAWVATTYRSAKDVVQLDDTTAGRLIAKGNFAVSWMMSPAWIRHTLTIEVKDGRFRYTLTNFEFDNTHWQAPLEDEKKFMGGRKSLFAKVCDQSEATITELEAAMQKVSPVGGSDW
jgi:uncharacterized protein with TBP-like fold DUF4468